MNYFFFLDLMIFFFSMQFLFQMKEGMSKTFYNKFSTNLLTFFGFMKSLPMSYMSSFNIFMFIISLCIMSYLPFSICILGLPEFTLLVAMISWLSVFLSFISSEKYSIFMSKSGDSFMITFFMLLMESLTEFLRPVTLTIRLTVNIVVGHMIGMGIYELMESKLNLSLSLLYLMAISIEFVVFLIQSFVFSRLISVYLSE